MLGKYIALYKYYCKVAPAVWRSRGQQCTGECKHPSLSRGILVVHWGQSIPRAHQRGNGKAWGKRSHQCNAAGTVKLGCTIGRIQQKPGNWIWDICGCSQHLEVQISLRCHKTHVPCCSVLCYSPRRKVRPICIKRIYGKAEKGHSVRLLLFFPLLRGIRPAPMTSDLISSDVFFSLVSLHTIAHLSLLLWASSRSRYLPQWNIVQLFSRTALPLQWF